MISHNITAKFENYKLESRIARGDLQKLIEFWHKGEGFSDVDRDLIIRRSMKFYKLDGFSCISFGYECPDPVLSCAIELISGKLASLNLVYEILE